MIEKAECSLSHLEKVCQRSVKDFYSCIFGNMTGTWSQASINKDMTPIMSKLIRDISATSSWTVTTYWIYRATSKCCWPFWPTKQVKTTYIDNNDHIVLWLTMIQGQQSLTLLWHSFSRWGRDHVTFSFSYKGWQYFVYDCLLPVATQITQDTWPIIVDALLTLCWRSVDALLTLCWRSVDALLTLIFKMVQGGYRNLFCL